MVFQTLINFEELAKHLDDPNWIIFDTRFSLSDLEYGQNEFQQGHIPGALYVHLENDLSSPVKDHTGRHPLPDFSLLTEKLLGWGVKQDSQVIVYDDASGAFAVRLWWLLKSLGHQAVALLDGGFKRWQQKGMPVSCDDTRKTEDNAVNHFKIINGLWLTTNELVANLNQKKVILIDARSEERFNGKQEPIDPVAGHIPGALNCPFQKNLDADGLFLKADQLANQFEALIGLCKPTQVVHMCGSGVTACHNLLAMEIAGLTGSKLYAGSWSEWIQDKTRPIAVASYKIST